MAYTLRQAVISPTNPTIELTMADTTALLTPIDNGQAFNLNPPKFLSGNIYFPSFISQTCNPPTALSINGYADAGYTMLLGATAYGISNNDFGNYTLGDISGGNDAYWTNAVVFGNWLFGLFSTDVDVNKVDLKYTFNSIGAFTGGNHVGAIGMEHYKAAYVFPFNPVWGECFRGGFESTTSTDIAPRACMIFDDRFEAGATRVGALRFHDDLTVDMVGLYITDVALDQNNYFYTSLIDGIDLYLIMHSGDGVGSEHIIWVKTTEQAWPPVAYTVEEAGFNDPALPTTLNALISSDIGNGGYIYSCALGFIVTYMDAPTPKFLLVDKDWQFFSNILISGDATTDAILAQFNLQSESPSLQYFDGTWFLIGGTLAAPSIAQSIVAVPSNDQLLPNNVVRLSCWSPCPNVEIYDDRS